MALMDCPECNEKISEHAEACPICGYPMKKHLENQGHFRIQEETKEEEDSYIPPPLPKAEKEEHHEAGCLFSIVSFLFFIIWLVFTTKSPHNMTYFSIALFICSGFYLKKPEFFSTSPGPKHKSMSIIFATYFLIASLYGMGLIYFKFSIPLPF